MKRLLLGALAASVMMSAVQAEDLRNVNVVNATGYGIKFLGFNNPGDDDWSDNELGSVLANGASVYVKFNTEDEGCVWNFRIEWADPGYPGVIWHDVDLCEIGTLVLHYDRSADTTSYTAR
jgi:opacity protein-like surface antigen